MSSKHVTKENCKQYSIQAVCSPQWKYFEMLTFNICNLTNKPLQNLAGTHFNIICSQFTQQNMPKCITFNNRMWQILWQFLTSSTKWLCFPINWFHRTCFQCQVLYSTINLPLQTRFVSCLMNGSHQKLKCYKYWSS